MTVMIDGDPQSSNNQPGTFGIEIEATTKVAVRNIWLKKLNWENAEHDEPQRIHRRGCGLLGCAHGATGVRMGRSGAGYPPPSSAGWRIEFRPHQWQWCKQSCLAHPRAGRHP